MLPQKDVLPESDPHSEPNSVNNPEHSIHGFSDAPKLNSPAKFGQKFLAGLDFSISRALLLLSIPVLSVVIFFALKVLTDPINFYWLISSEPPSIPTYGLEPPLTQAEINAQLKDADRVLGKKLEFAKDDKRLRSQDAVAFYPVLDTANQEIREVRVYQTLPNSGKLQLLSRAEVNGLDDWFVLAPKGKFGSKEKIKVSGDRFSLKKLQLISGKSPSYGSWFMATGSTAKVEYGIVLAYVSQPRPSLTVLSEWTSTPGKPPQWQNLIQDSVQWALNRKQSELVEGSDQKQLAKREPQLVIEQHQDFEPDFQIYQPELVSNPLQPLDLRQITLNEGLGLPSSYSQSLILASAGVWSTALEKLEQAKSEQLSEKKELSNYVLEQYALIAAHAQLTAKQADRPNANPGRQALLFIIDGRWKEAVAMAAASDSNAKSVLEVLKPYTKNILSRLEVMQKLKIGNLEIAQSAGAIAVMADQGLQAAKKWLNSQAKNGTNQTETIALLDRLDVLPFKIKPQQLLGIVTPITNRDPGKGWQIATEALPDTENWYVVDISLMQDQDNWQTGIFTELIGRSPIAVWKLLGLNRTDTLTLSTLDDLGLSTNSFLRAHSYAVSADGKLRILVAGSPDLAQSLKKSEIPAIATTNGTLPATTGVDTIPSNLPAQILELMTNSLYQELRTLGEVSLKPEEFRRQLSGWTLKSIDLNSNGKIDYVLEIDRLKVDMGDRRYPIIIAFDNSGNILYSEISGDRSRRWVTILPSKNGGQILTEVEGNYQIWSLPE
jgi:hypothetical protein